MYHPLKRSHLYTAYKITADFCDYGQTKSKSGTGFFIEDGNSFSLCTNRHVLEPGFREQAAQHWVLKRIYIDGFNFPEFQKISFAINVLGSISIPNQAR
jgi:hypothetical protein